MGDGARVPPSRRGCIATIEQIPSASREAVAAISCQPGANRAVVRWKGLLHPLAALLRRLFRRRAPHSAQARFRSAAERIAAEAGAAVSAACATGAGHSATAHRSARIDRTFTAATANAETDDAAPPERGFLAGTAVMLMTGTTEIDRLVPGRRLVTRAGAMPIAALRRRQPRKPLVHVAPGVFGPDQTTALVLAADQPVRLEPWRRLLFPGRGPVVRAAELVDGQFVTRLEPRPGMALVEILTERPALARIGGHDFPTAAPAPAHPSRGPVEEDPIARPAPRLASGARR